MDKVLVNLYIPSISEFYDVYLPTSLNVREIVRMLGEAMESMSEGRYYSSNHEILCNVDTGMVLSEDCTLADHSIKNADKLMLC